ncbi:toxin-antitoxin system YwqK family antitoxin [Sabulibacter ruber]|uniref:toxin-antitoxin system YwqK family antitoxin n=1 Tax=Sabulibacter ruber TaxID=2811901 RepID=UPI001A977C0D|nr:hypothetical protein [Sabulibacter ruber]
MGRKELLSLLIALWFVAPHQSGGAVWPWKWNQVDKDGNRKGRWRAYYDHKPGQLMYTGRFKKGKETGTWKTYSENGKLERLEKYEPRLNRIKTTFYHPNGKVSHQGMAYLFQEKNLLMYKWHGDWHYYDSTGVWRGWKSFSRGLSMSPEPIKTNRAPEGKK